MAGSRHPASKVRGGQEKPPRARGQGAVTLRSHPEPEARGSSWQEPPTPEARVSSREEQPPGVVAAQAQEGLEELSHVEGQEPWW